jgi:hypothetical protein
MTDDYRIYVDANWPATLNDGAGVLTDFPTLQEAVSAWRSLAPEQKIRATIRVVGGPVYTVKQIDRLHSVRSYRDVALLPAALELAGFILKDRGSLDEPMSSIVQGGGKRRFLGEWIGVKCRCWWAQCSRIEYPRNPRSPREGRLLGRSSSRSGLGPISDHTAGPRRRS